MSMEIPRVLKKLCLDLQQHLCQSDTQATVVYAYGIGDLILSVYIYMHFTIIRILEDVNSLKPTDLEIPEKVSELVGCILFLRGSLSLPFRVNKLS